jgi:hypothetical protein
MYKLFEGGAAIPTSQPVEQVDVPLVVATAKREMPQGLLKNLQGDIGSAGFKQVPSGDIDLMIEAGDLVEIFKTQEDKKDPVLAAKRALKTYFDAKGIEANINGRNVSIGIKYKAKNGAGYAQVDLMVIHDAAVVAPWHQHGRRDMYKDPAFKGQQTMIIISSIAKALNLKFDAFGANLVDRNTGELKGRTMDEVAKILIAPEAKASDMYSVGTIVAALQKYNDADTVNRKLAQARDDQAKGLLTLPEQAPRPGTAAWFRNLGHQL